MQEMPEWIMQIQDSSWQLSREWLKCFVLKAEKWLNGILHHVNSKRCQFHQLNSNH